MAALKKSKTQLKMQVLFRKALGISSSVGKSLSNEQERYFLTGITALEWSGNACLFELDFSELSTGVHRAIEKTVVLNETEVNKIESKFKER